MANGDVFADCEWPTVGIEVARVGNVQHSAVLDAGARAYANAMHVASHNGARPDGYVVGKFDIADDNGSIINKYTFAQLGLNTFMSSDRRGHGSPLVKAEKTTRCYHVLVMFLRFERVMCGLRV